MSKRRHLLIILLAVIFSTGSTEAQPEDRQLYIVTLKDPPVAERLAAGGGSASLKARLQGAQAQAQARDLATVQAQVVARLEAALPGRLDVVDACTYLTNSLFVRTDADGRARLEQDPDVAAVVPADLRYPVLDAAHSAVQAQALWDLAGGAANAGQGVKIAIVDSGIDVTHPAFRGDGMPTPPGYPKWDSNGLNLTNAKVIVARSYHRLFPNNQTVVTPVEEQGHGTRVAAVAGGRPANAPLAAIQGMAPMAWLGNYKVFGTPGVNSNTTSAAIIKAVEDAVLDGMDIINLSLGGSPRDPAGDPEQEAIARAVQAGVVVVVAAGNEGPGPGSVTSPGTSPAAITVGAVSNFRVFGPGIQIQGSPQPPAGLRTVAYTPGGEVTIPAAIGPAQFRSIVHFDPTELACNPFPTGSLAGQVVLVRRGTCLFQDKANHVFNAGARALVVYNHLDEGTIIMQFTQVRGPSVMIDRLSGEGLRDYLQTGAQASATIRAENDLQGFSGQGDVLLGFSGRGPAIDGGIKPDLVSIGNRLYTPACTNSACPSGNGLGGYLLNSSGTSFATPMVAGAAAILRQLHPGWTPDQIKGLLVGTAAKTPLDGAQAARVTQVGNGRLDLAAAVGSELAFSPVSWSLGPLQSSQVAEVPSRQFRLTNLGTRTRSLRMDYWVREGNPSVSFQVHPAVANLTPGASITVTVTPAFRLPLSGGAVEGYLRVRDAGGNSLLTAPIWGSMLVPNPDRVLTIHQGGAGDFSTLSAALGEAEPGNVIQFLDSATYSEQVSVNVNKQGIPLDGIVIRAADGNRPVLDGSVVAPSSPVVRVKGVQQVRLEGLEVSGGLQGIEFDQASGAVVDATVRSQAESATGYGITAQSSRVHVYRSRLEASGGAAIVVSGGSALVQQTRIEPGPGLIHSGHGLMALNSGPVSVFDSRIASVGVGVGAQGLRLSASRVLAKGNTIVNGSGISADGIFARSTLSLLEAFDNFIAGHGRNGFNLTEAAAGYLSGNWVQDNRNAGLQASGSSLVVADRNRFLGNQNGVLAAASSLTLQNSLVAQSSQDGIRVTGSVTQLLNSTVSGNSSGLLALDPISSSVVNSILTGNGLNLSGTSPGQVTYSLVNGSPPAGSGNQAGDPGFRNPSTGDYRLRVDSPAIDAGNDQAAAFELDLSGNARRSGERVDLGALEYGPEQAPTLGFPVLSSAPQDFIGVALTYLPSPALVEAAPSPSGEELREAGVSLRMRAPGGPVILEQERQLAAGAQFSSLLSELFNPASGWLEVKARRPEVTGFALLGDNQLSKLDGAILAPARSRHLVFSDIATSGEQSRVFLINPEPRDLALNLRWTTATGGVQLQAMGLAAGRMLELDPAAMFAAAEGGWLRVDASGSISGFLLSGTTDTVIGLPGLAAEDGASELQGAQLAVNPAIDSVITLVNLGDAAVVTLEAIDEAGVGRASAQVLVGPERLFRGSAAQLFGLTDFVGWLRVRAAGASLVGSVRFTDPGGRWAAALPLAAAGAREFVLSHVAQADNIFTGITLLNPNPGDSLVSLEVFDRSGSLTGTALTELAANQKRALLLPEWIPGLDSQIGGYVRVRSTRPLVGFELFGSPDYLAAVPAQVLVH